ncbi:hypothetical protein [Haloferula sp. A504]|uniref:hypothetical protein n=1 Tax=Haloferula sp. A504 TaxID=3373601 RepID=UPI0031C23594|nr:hypothetical protein [Verrucomicrobiaceae bacterium E54]
MNPRLILLLTFGLVLIPVSPASAQRSYSVPQGINVLSSSARLVGLYVEKHYPEARTHAFEDVIHFEHLTAVHVLPAIAMNPKPPRVAVRGPLAGGVWCDIAVLEGALSDTPYARAEGAIDRGPFIEHLHYVAPPLEPNHHLIVTVRLPKDAGDAGSKFVEGLQETLEQFRIERQTETPPAR